MNAIAFRKSVQAPGRRLAANKITAIKRKTVLAVAFAVIGLMVACGTKEGERETGSSTPAKVIRPTEQTATGTSTVSADASQSVPTKDAAVIDTAPKDAGSPSTANDAGSKDAGRANGRDSAVEKDAATDPLKFTNVDICNDAKRRFGAPHVAFNPKDPNNIVVVAGSNLGYTQACQAAGDPDCELIPQYIGAFALGTAPRGFYKTHGFMDIGVFYSFDRGKTWKQVDVSDLYPMGHPEISTKGEAPLMVTADGTFYIGYNAVNWGDWEAPIPNGFPNGGIGVIKSTDGGRTWKGAWLTGTPADWPYGGSDVSTGTIYVVSGTPMSDLGPRATGNPDSPTGGLLDRWLASSQDGVNWTKPQPLGGTNGTTHVSGSHSSVFAAHGIVATMFLISDAASCEFFIGLSISSCVVFQTSTDKGVTWNRHRVPVPDRFTPNALTGMMFAADPSKAGHFTAVLGDSDGTGFWAYQTADSGNTWSGPTMVTEDETKYHFGSWLTYSPEGVLGLMWRTNEPPAADSSTYYPPYSVWAVISHDGGSTFSKPLRVSKHNSPAPPAKDEFDYWNGYIGDHGPSSMAMDDRNQTAYVAWGDWTPGERTIMFSAINWQAFKKK